MFNGCRRMPIFRASALCRLKLAEANCNPSAWAYIDDLVSPTKIALIWPGCRRCKQLIGTVYHNFDVDLVYFLKKKGPKRFNLFI